MADQLRMTFDPMTIEHLGVRMYSTLPPVLSELVANSSDADATRLDITLKDADGTKEIVVADDGEGMTFVELNEKFLRIGRNRREDEQREVTTKGRKVIGKKGLGKLSFFGIAGEIEVVTRKEGKENAFLMRWEDIKTSGVAGNEYNPTALRTEEDCDPTAHGTTITLRAIDRASDFQAEHLATSLSKIFITDPGFAIFIHRNGGGPITVMNERKYESLEKEVEWKVPDEVGDVNGYLAEKAITGHLIAARTPIPPKTNMRGVTLFSRKKLVNLPEYFSDSTSSHFYSYLTGWLEVDFIDDLPEDVIATNRQSLNWDHPEMVILRDKLRALLNWLERDWRKKREAARHKDLTDKTGINIEDWLSKVPDDVKKHLGPLLTAVVRDSELPVEATGTAMESIHALVPEYPKYHWRHLHPQVKEVSKQYYEDENYYTAFLEAAKRYADAVRAKSGVTQDHDRPAMEMAFRFDTPGPILSVTEGYKKTDGSDFKETTLSNIREAQRMLSVGVVCGGRNVVDHEEITELKATGLFTEIDCLDALSLLSHLFWRLEHSTKVR